MYVAGKIRSRALPVLSFAALAFLVSPVCSSWIPPQRRLTPVANPALPIHISGMGINCHFTELPVRDLKAIGVQWVRVDLGGGPMRYESVKRVVDHYKDFGILWLIGNEDHDGVAEARLVASLGVTDIEVLNEPEFTSVKPSQYASFFRRVRNAVGNRVRLYGPSINTWNRGKPYLDAVLDEGIPLDGITFHPYLVVTDRVEDMSGWVRQAKSFGLPVIASEIGFTTKDPYRASGAGGSSLAGLFIRTKRALDGIPWCWYDGPNPPEDNDGGLFDFVPGGGFRTNHNYRDIKAALDALKDR